MKKFGEKPDDIIRPISFEKSLFWPLAYEDGVVLSVCNLLTHFTITVFTASTDSCNTAEKFADFSQDEVYSLTWS